MRYACQVQLVHGGPWRELFRGEGPPSFDPWAMFTAWVRQHNADYYAAQIVYRTREEM